MMANVADQKKMSHLQTLIEMLRRSAENTENASGIVYINDKGEEEWISYYELWNLAASYGSTLKDRGVKPDDRIGIIVPTSKEFLGAFWGALYVGAIPFALYPPTLMESISEYQKKIRRVLSHAEPAAIITIPPIRTVIMNSTQGTLSKNILIPKNFTGHSLYEPAKRSSTDVAFMQFTSGSTALPRGVVLTHENVLSNIRAISTALIISDKDIGISWLPPFHDMGLIGKLMVFVYNNTKLIWMSPQYFLRSPIRWLEAVSKYGGTISAAPNFAYSLCVRRVRDKDLPNLNLSSWRLALNGAEMVDPSTIRAFIKKFAPCGFKPEAMFPAYGLAESSLAVTFPRLNAKPVIDTINRKILAEEGRAETVEENPSLSLSLASCGKAIPTIEVKVVDENGKEREECMVGKIEVSGPSVCNGYYKNKEATGKIIKDGWLYTGDLGYIKNGNLYITGRIKDMIIIRGRNYIPQDIETAAEEIRGVRKGRTVAFSVFDKETSSEKGFAAVEVSTDNPEERARIRNDVLKKIQETIGIRLRDVILLKPGALPKTSSGKLQRSLAKKLYLEDILTKRGRMNRLKWMLDFYLQRIIKIFRKNP